MNLKMNLKNKFKKQPQNKLKKEPYKQPMNLNGNLKQTKKEQYKSN